MDPASITVILNCRELINKIRQEEENKNKEKIEYYTYLPSKFLALSTGPKEEKVAIVIHGVLSSNHTIHIEWPVQVAFYVDNLDGVEVLPVTAWYGMCPGVQCVKCIELNVAAAPKAKCVLSEI